MGERITKLKATLDELRAELDRVEDLASDERRLLESTVDDLRRRLNRAPTGDDQDYDSLVEQLEELEGRFQIRHPTLAGMILRLVDVLGQLGI